MFKTCFKLALLGLVSSHLYGQSDDVQERLAELESWMKESKQQKGSLSLKTDQTVLSVGGRIELVVRGAAPTSNNKAKNILAADASDHHDRLHLDFDATGSRLWTKTVTPSSYGYIRTLIEVDFVGENGFRLRHAYAQVGNWTFGQTNSAFNTLATLDIIEYPINDALVRQPLIRYTIEGKVFAYDLSFEEPKSTLRNSAGVMITPDDELIPDIVARVRYYPQWGEAALSLLGRYINYEDNAKDHAYGWGANFSARLNVGSDDIRVSGEYGKGIGRYIAYNSFAAGSVDADGQITLQTSYGGSIGYRHWWSSELRSTLSYAYVATEKNDYVAALDTNTKDAYTTTANILWSPVLNSLVGLEYTNTKLTAQSMKKNDLNAINLCLRYDF